MWLIDTETLELTDVPSPEACRYAILSHTWERDEVDFREMKEKTEATQNKAGYSKIKRTCDLAREKGYNWAWIDTCCIDQTSSAALSEAINSMFDWYRQSSLCIAYLSDLPTQVYQYQGRNVVECLKNCKWFTRGWTLPELIAPERVEFYDQSWRSIGSKEFHRQALSSITGIDVEVLANCELLPEIPVGRKMSWAANRNTTRVEDLAYSLLGIFDVNMPVIYGEGKKAFIRLQEEIAKNTNDLTLFAWTSQVQSGEDMRPARRNRHAQDFRGVLAHSPAEFRQCGRINIIAPAPEFAMTNNGLRIETILRSTPNSHGYIFPLGCESDDTRARDHRKKLGIYLAKTETGFVRDRADELFATSDESFEEGTQKRIYVAKSLSTGRAQKLRAQFLRSLHFVFSLHLGYKEKDVHAKPSNGWDPNNRHFVTGDQDDFTACVDFTIRPRYWRFVIVCGLIYTDSKKPRVKDLWDSDDKHVKSRHEVTPWMVIYSDHDKPEMAAINRHIENDDLRRLRRDVLGWHTKDGAVSLREMAEIPKTRGDEDGLLSYYMTMVEDFKHGSPIFNIRVVIRENSRIETGPAMADGGGDDERQYIPQQPPQRAPEPPRDETSERPNPFVSREEPHRQHYPMFYDPSQPPPVGVYHAHFGSPLQPPFASPAIPHQGYYARYGAYPAGRPYGYG